MLVRDYMTPYPKSLHPNDTLTDAAKLFFKYRINGAPVVTDDNKLCGLLTCSDLAKVIIDELSYKQPVSTVMTHNVITITPDAALEDAARIPVNQIPVVSADNQILGMITKSDFFSAFRTKAERATDEITAFIRSAHNGIIVINAYGIITTFNDAAAKLAGIPAGQAIGHSIEDIIPDSGLKQVLHTGVSETGCHLTLNGLTVFSNRSPICEGPKIVGALAIIQDTSDLTQVARQLSISQHTVEALENVFESARQGIVVVDQAGIITRVNKSFEDIFNVSREDLLGHLAAEMIENTRMHIVVKSGIPELAEIHNYKGRQVIVNRIPMFQNGKITGAIGEAIFKDITEVNYLLERLHMPGKTSVNLQVGRPKSK